MHVKPFTQYITHSRDSITIRNGSHKGLDLIGIRVYIALGNTKRSLRIFYLLLFGLMQGSSDPEGHRCSWTPK